MGPINLKKSYRSSILVSLIPYYLPTKPRLLLICSSDINSRRVFRPRPDKLVQFYRLSVLTGTLDGKLVVYRIYVKSVSCLGRVSLHHSLRGSGGTNLVPRVRDLQEKNRELWDNPKPEARNPGFFC